jgi:hypothetical protein
MCPVAPCLRVGRPGWGSASGVKLRFDPTKKWKSFLFFRERFYPVLQAMGVDYRCTYSGVSLLGAEIMAVLTARPVGEQVSELRPIALPIWGEYNGTGGIVESNPGPNAERILEAWQADCEQGRAGVDWEVLGIAPLPILHVETLFALIRANEIHGHEAVLWRGHHLSLAFFESNVAAAAMQGEPAHLRAVLVDQLAPSVLGTQPLVSSIYGELARESATLRCKYGLGFIALGALLETMRAEGLLWSNPEGAIEESESEPALWLTQAFQRFSGNELMVEALEEYANRLLGTDDEPEALVE